MAERDFTHLTPDEKINGIKASKLPDHIRSKYHGEDVREALAQSTEMAIQLGINMGLSPDDALSWARKLQEAVPRSEFDSWVATLLDGGPSIFMNTLNELKTTYPNGAAGVALVRETDPAKIYVWNGAAWEDFGDYQGVEIADGSITAKKLANNTINLSKLSFSKIDSRNVFDLESAEVGSLRADGSVDKNGTNFYTSDFMRFNPGDVVTANFNLQSSAVYDINMNKLSATIGTIHAQITMPSNGYYAKVTRHAGRIDEFMVVSGLMPDTYEPFKRVVSGDIIEDDTISLGKLNFVSQGKNLFNPEEVIKGKYVNPTSGVLQSNPAYDTTIVKEASPNEKYTITYPRFVVFYGLDNNIIPSESITFDVPPESLTITMPSNGYGYQFSFPTINKIQIEKGDVATYYEPYMRVIDDVSVRSSNIVKYGDRVTKSTSKGDLTDGQRLVSGKANSIKKNKTYSFSSKIISFYGLRMGQGETDYGGSYIEITASELKFFDYRGTVTPRAVLTHGLTISNFIDVLITIDKDANAIVRVMTDGGFYESTPQKWEGYNGTPFAKSMGSTLTDGEFVFDTSDFDKPIYFFGDSYAGLTAKDRWVNYIREWGFDNWFINAYPGQASLSAKGMLDFALSKGNPEILIWGLGMNDGDSSSSVNENWLNTYNQIKGICESRDIELVLCTIPNVPSINNSFKNEIIRDSGYRYIDFAKAVGAEEVGSNWYTGMLSGDKVHPSTLGAQKLALRAIEDVPELSTENDEGQRKIDHANMSAELAGKADNVFLKNLIENGDFRHGLSGWGNHQSSISMGLENSMLKATYISIINNTYITAPSHTYIEDNVYYARTTLIPKMNIDDIRHYYNGVYHQPFLLKPTPNVEHILSNTFKGMSGGTTANQIRLLNNNSNVGDSVLIKDSMLINLTDVFGEGNEPTKEEMDELIKVTGYIDGKYALNNKEMLDYLLKGIREKANKKQEDWITPTLLNGATGTVQYRKNEFGMVQIQGSVSIPNPSLQPFLLPVGYRPKVTFSNAVTSINTNNVYKFTIGASGSSFLNVANTVVDLTGISFE